MGRLQAGIPLGSTYAALVKNPVYHDCGRLGAFATHRDTRVYRPVNPAG